MKRLSFALGLILLGRPLGANVIDIAASERGTVFTSYPGQTNNGESPTNNYFAGQQVPSMSRDWFEFSIPTLAGSLVSSTLNLEQLGPGQPGLGHSGGTLTFSVYGLSGEPIVFTDVASTDPFGSISTSSTDDGTTLSITLDAAGLAAISADQGGNLFIGGIDSGENISPMTGDFGGTGFNALGNTTLVLTTAPSAIPEPSSVPFLIGAVVLALLAFGKRSTGLTAN